MAKLINRDGRLLTLEQEQFEESGRAYQRQIAQALADVGLFLIRVAPENVSGSMCLHVRELYRSERERIMGESEGDGQDRPPQSDNPPRKQSL